MRRQSKLIEEKKKEELLRCKNLSPEQRIAAAIEHNKFLKELCYAGLTELEGIRKGIAHGTKRKSRNYSQIKVLENSSFYVIN